jgi:hypothetical protein
MSSPAADRGLGAKFGCGKRVCDNLLESEHEHIRAGGHQEKWVIFILLLYSHKTLQAWQKIVKTILKSTHVKDMSKAGGSRG